MERVEALAALAYLPNFIDKEYHDLSEYVQKIPITWKFLPKMSFRQLNSGGDS